MNKVLKDGLKEVINVKVCESVSLECDSIDELITGWYLMSKDNIGYESITYKDNELKIIYDAVTDDEEEVIEETDFITIRKDLQEQINVINSKEVQ
jgi:hypothetical protein